MRRLASCLLAAALVLLAGAAWSVEKDLKINAHSVDYDNVHNLIEATGSVEALYKDFSASGEHLIYHTDTRVLTMDRGFKFKYEEVDLKGGQLTYEVQSRRGEAQKVSALYDRLTLTGQKVNFDPEKLELHDAGFNSCGLAGPHYNFTASDIQLYPKSGWLVAYWGLFYLQGIPTIPVPVYIYDVEAQRRGEGNVLPYPVLGSNAEDGNFISESFAWTRSRELFGSVTLGYLEKKGLSLGVAANYLNDQNNSGKVRLAGNPKDGIWGGWTHQYAFGDLIIPGEKFAFRLFNLPSFHRYDLVSDLTYRERINYERVSQLPNLKLTVRRIDWGEIKGVGEAQAGYITEESTGVSLARYSLAADLVRPYPLGGWGYLTPGVNLNGTYYGNHTNWRKIQGRLVWDSTLGENFTTSLGYYHYFLNQGTSPFRYELYRFTSSDQVTAGFIYSWQLSKLGVSAAYNLPSGAPQDIDYLFKVGFHCYSIGATYRAMRNEFYMIFNLI